MADAKVVNINFIDGPLQGQGGNATVTDPVPVEPPDPPITELPPSTAAWHIRDDGAYFVMGPFDKPQSLGPNCQLDPAKTVWTKSMDGLGWTLLSGPYDKPFPIFGEEPPPVDPPVDPPPVDLGGTTISKWVYISPEAGWAFVTATTFSGGKPRPIHPPGEGEGGGGAKKK